MEDNRDSVEVDPSIVSEKKSFMDRIPKPKMPESIRNNPVLIAFIAAMTISIQGYYMHLTNSQPKKRNLVIVTKSPLRLIARWDTLARPDLEDNANAPERSRVGEVGLLIERILTSVDNDTFAPYKFNENVYIRINTADIKTDEAKINLDETTTSKGIKP